MTSNARPRAVLRTYPNWFYLPAAIVFGVFFLVPTALAFYFSLTRWTLFDATFIGLDNYVDVPGRSPAHVRAAQHDHLCRAHERAQSHHLAAARHAAHLEHPAQGASPGHHLLPGARQHRRRRDHVLPRSCSRPMGLINTALGFLGLPQPDWLGNPSLALYSVALVDVWKGVGLATVIFIAGILSIPLDYFEAARLEGGTWVKFRHVIIPLARNATFTVILLSFIGGLRSFDLIWTMTHGGPGFASDVLTSVIYKEYQAGFYGLSTAGNVVLFILVTIIVYPLMRFFNRHGD